MEQHPVPQNISGFQFKLIGDITLKQFVYIAGGLIIGYLMTKFTLFPSFLRWPLGIFLAILGLSLAFVPIEERPLDRWLMAFFKSVYSPTQYVYKKNNLPPEILTETGFLPASAVVIHAEKTKVKTTVVKPVPKSPATVPVPKQIPTPVPVPVAPKTQPQPIPPHLPKKTTPEPTKKDWWTIGAPPPKIKTPPKAEDSGSKTPVTGKKVVITTQTPVTYTPVPDPKQLEKLKTGFQKKSEKLSEQIVQLQKELSYDTIAKERLLELQQLLGQLLLEKEQMSRELIKLKQELVIRRTPITEKPTAFTEIPEERTTTVKFVPAAAAKLVGIPKITNVPNLINGLIKNSQGVMLPNIIITVKDKEGVPVRALKTNKLGQFAASTSLSDGVYVISIEDPKKTYQFNQVEVTLVGQPLLPLEIFAVSEKDLMRQQLTREIFGGHEI